MSREKVLALALAAVSLGFVALLAWTAHLVGYLRGHSSAGEKVKQAMREQSMKRLSSSLDQFGFDNGGEDA